MEHFCSFTAINYCELFQTALWWASEKDPDCGAGIIWCDFIKDLGIVDEEMDSDQKLKSPEKQAVKQATEYS